MNKPLKAASGALLAAAAAQNLPAAEAQSVQTIVGQIQSEDDKVRGPAWQNAGPLGAPAVPPIAELLTHRNFEVARAASRALWKIVRQAGRPGADAERAAVAASLLPLLKNEAEPVRRDALWMLSEIGGDAEVPAIAALLQDKAVHDDARSALERIPGQPSLAALKSALETTPEKFRPAIAQSLRVRGVKVEAYPSQKLVPTRPSQVKPA
jgi:HEAT repeat protein